MSSRPYKVIGLELLALSLASLTVFIMAPFFEKSNPFDSHQESRVVLELR